ncbi:MAG: flippase-like domain-containing protein [Deltaproteobacteria bacterium]|nr:flippase-like domain-containing protein [Deltaproteobacteria bacterium]HPX19535.1 lysylphosphatidylglycerol synthase transmembrane domain-containing protein [Deltaproteobacteria bacterium]
MINLNRRTYISLAVGLLFSAIALYFTFVNIPIRELVDYLKNINYWWVAPSLVMAFLSYVLRAVRWQLILLPVKKTGFWSSFHPVMIGFMLSSVFPGRVGEIARPAIFYKRENVEFSKVLATAGIDRILDAVTLLAVFVYILATVSIDPSLDIVFGDYHLTPALLDDIWTATLKFSIAIIGMIALISFSTTRAVFNRIILKTPDILFFTQQPFKEKLRAGLCTSITSLLDNLAVGFDILKTPFNLVLCLLLSFALWALLGFALLLMTFGFPGVEITFLQAFAVEIIICFFIMLPSVPGYWGLWEAGGVFGLMIFGIPATEAAGLTLAYHFFHMVPVIIVGIVSAMIIGVKLVKTIPQEPRG